MSLYISGLNFFVNVMERIIMQSVRRWQVRNQPADPFSRRTPEHACEGRVACEGRFYAGTSGGGGGVRPGEGRMWRAMNSRPTVVILQVSFDKTAIEEDKCSGDTR